mmetsp:Transcript_15841/g.43725  ORF Transcript_15841/g.43725 Transcript_15841/m.43725 type:complete len:252 (-) Transcript_15841:730-1485(-)|eukprot:CAMPEP_0198125188 /NCGR_PEP_ID=MMETSP1442-20131203/41965_1 /TAXON_ID= /ORGANISM="Craspedostauros australis, Strain CCMP3328" /LENGTH=251 /DNA_ID=CAMNT_0043784743 /DNA_START=427 /DNA_END=1182 /DNA_ORIENTATION=-
MTAKHHIPDLTMREPQNTDQSAPPQEPSNCYELTWEADAAQQIHTALQNTSTTKPFMVCVVGIPGSGKSVSCFLLASALESLQLPCMIMPHDGYHYTMAHLKTLHDADDRIYRRGAPDTFDPRTLLHDLQRIRDGDEAMVTVPAFDHAVGDPEPDKHIFDRKQHRVVICEGLYLLHEDDGWKEIPEMFDLKIYIESDIDKCMDRLKIRNQCIPGYTPEEIAVRVDEVDRKNAETVMRSSERADMKTKGVAS